MKLQRKISWFLFYGPQCRNCLVWKAKSQKLTTALHAWGNYAFYTFYM